MEPVKSFDGGPALPDEPLLGFPALSHAHDKQSNTTPFKFAGAVQIAHASKFI
jgi:hypothetical protein